MFWDTDEWKARAERQHRMHEVAEQYPVSPDETPENTNAFGSLDAAAGATDHLAVRPPLDRGRTAVSELSDERSSASGEYEDAQEAEDREMKCRRCGGVAFAAKRLKDGGTCLVCSRCGSRV